jgi:hypothetical protein
MAEIENDFKELEITPEIDISDYEKRIILDEKIKIILKTIIQMPNLNHINKLKNKPWWNVEHTRFQTYLNKYFTGTHLVAFPDKESSDALLKINTLCIPDENYVLKEMKQSRCHNNCTELFLLNNTIKIFYGYALSDDGLWRNHSWCVNKEGIIIETTVSRLLYLGYDMNFLDNY